MHYRLYLYDSEDHVSAAETYSATNDREALEIGHAVFEAASDHFKRHEVWCGATLLKGVLGFRRTLALTEVMNRHEENVLELEERLQRTFNSVKRSRNLLETIDRLRERKLYTC
jgi:PII-like signaling protein